MKIFWSWQSDTPKEIGHYLVRDALKDAIKRLKQSEEIEEARRESMELDHDIKDVTGSPDLVRTILEKIEKSEIVVADVTLVGKTPKGKCLINSSVAIELGYAWSECTDSHVMMVFNKHYGSYENLPFDLRHKGGAVDFDLPPEAGREEIASMRRALTGEFVRKLKPFLKEPSRIKEHLSIRAFIDHRISLSHRMPSGGTDDVVLLMVGVENIGEQVATDFRLDVEIPAEFVDGSLPYGCHVESITPGFSRVSILNTNPTVKLSHLYPEVKTRPLFNLNIGVRDEIKKLRPADLEKKIIATVYSGNMKPRKTYLAIKDLLVGRD